MIRRWCRRSVGPLGLAATLVLGLVPGGAAADEDFVSGSGRARASIFEVVPRTGGLTIPISFGRSLASYRGVRAEASSTGLASPSGDGPLPAGAGLRPAECHGAASAGGGLPGGARDAGGPPGAGAGSAAPGAGPAAEPPGGGGVPSNPFVSTITVGSDEDGAEDGRRASWPPSPPGSPVQGAASDQEVAADRTPSARATTVEGRFGAAGVVEYTRARAEARAGVVERRAREAHAVVSLDRLGLLGGALEMEGLRWEATQRTGHDPVTEGSFSVGRVTIAGTPLPGLASGEAPDLFAAVNEALAPTGLALDPPRVEAGDGLVTVTPLSLRLADSPLGRTTVGPLLGALQPVREPLVDGLLALSCDLGALVTVADVIAGVASGAGGVSFDIGGVSATTEGVRYDNPFAGPIDDPFGALAPDGPDEVPPAEGGLSVPAPGVGLPRSPLPPGDTPQPAGDTVPPGAEAAAPAGAGVSPPVGPSSRRLPGSRGGVAVLAAALGLAAVLLVAGADARHLRRAARSIP